MSIVLFAFISSYLLFTLFIVSGLFKHSVLPIESENELPMVSIVVAARNEETSLPNLIEDLVNQEYPLDKLEVIFIDDRSIDSTLDILKEASNNYAFINTLSQNLLTIQCISHNFYCDHMAGPGSIFFSFFGF